MWVRARTTFQSRGRLVDMGDVFEADEDYGRALMRGRLVEITDRAAPENSAHLTAPERATGKSLPAGQAAASSALPAGQVSPPTIANASAPGAPAKRRRRQANVPDLLPPDPTLDPADPMTDASSS